MCCEVRRKAFGGVLGVSMLGRGEGGGEGEHLVALRSFPLTLSRFCGGSHPGSGLLGLTVEYEVLNNGGGVVSGHAAR